MTGKRQITYHGETYANLRELCDEYGISYHSLTRAIHKKGNLEDAMDLVYHRHEKRYAAPPKVKDRPK
jgi:hypothetical protein